MKINKNNIDLLNTITCGQIFRYIVDNDTYILFLDDRVVKIIDKESYMIVDSSNNDNLEEKVIKYLDLDRDYESINKSLIEKDNNLKDIISKCTGFKVINSPKLETIISYMISANNNVSNISRCVNLLCEKYGDKVIYEGNTYYLFPNLSTLKKMTPNDFKELKLGFRANYIYEFVQKIDNDKINYIDNLSTDEAINYLMSYKGIGLKIASCILLFGYQRFDAFPIDIWVKRYMKDAHNILRIKEIKEYAKNNYGIYSGLVLQYMFHEKRNIDEKGN